MFHQNVLTLKIIVNQWVLNDELIANHVYGEFGKKAVPLMSSKEKVKQIKVRVVL